ncbi:hypothetical protein AX15_003234 [Amanita polypyramis BW_CC]|nr:hypothetical protein AX15_003234 [Amanita polypyramis BW_CC]
MLPSPSFVLFSLLQVSHAINVYLHPQAASITAEPSPERASFALARHLDIEWFEPPPLRDSSPIYYEDTLLFRESAGNALVVALDSSDADAVIPDEIELTYALDSPELLDSLSSVLHSLLARAPHAYSAVYGDSGPLWRMSELDNLSSFLETEESGFAAVELGDLSKIRSEFGPMSDEYTSAVDRIQLFLRSTINRADKVRLAVLTFNVDDRQKRDVIPRQEQSPLPSSQPLPQQPIGSISACFTTQDACRNGTNSCSSRGQCVEATKSGRTCFVCSCSATHTGEGTKRKTDIWVGESCERKDVSAPFVLLTGTVVVLTLLVIGSVSLLSGVGQDGLPSTLLSTTVSKKD